MEWSFLPFCSFVDFFPNYFPPFLLLLPPADPHLQSNWDDGEGYYKARIGECVGDRFRILGVVGKGVFSTVLKCVDLYSPSSNTNTTNVNNNGAPSTVTNASTQSAAHVAIKMIRNNDTMRKAAEKEKSILLSIAQADPQNTKYCVRLLTHLDYRTRAMMYLWKIFVCKWAVMEVFGLFVLIF